VLGFSAISGNLSVFFATACCLQDSDFLARSAQ
jgi:hypothetical protein